VVTGTVFLITFSKKYYFRLSIPPYNEDEMKPIERKKVMTNEQFALLVKKLEAKASKQPRFYRFKVLLLTGLGYSYVLTFLAIFVLLFGFSIFMLVDTGITMGNLKMLLFTGALSFIILKALLFKLEMPTGYYIEKSEAEELIRVLDELRAKLQTQPIHSIVLNNEFNASVAQIPKFGLIGPKQNVLLLGVPLMSALTPAQFKAVLAHELAHISHSDTAFGARIYRVRRTWGRLLQSLVENEQFGTFLFRWFFKWYYPRYDAYTFVLARQQEYEADREAGKATSNKDLAEALSIFPIAAPYYYEDFYNDLFEDSARNQSTPNPYSSFSSKVSTLDGNVYSSIFQNALEEDSDVTDTHPSLKERLAALNVEPEVVKISGENAFHAFFNKPSEILETFDNEWKQRNEENWLAHLEQHNEEKRHLEELEHKEMNTFDDLMEKAALTNKLKGRDASIPVYEQVITQYPSQVDTAIAYLIVAESYLKTRDRIEEALVYIERAAELSWEQRLAAYDMYCWYYHEIQDEERFEQAKERYFSWSEILEKSDREAGYVSEDDNFAPHDKTLEEIEACVEQLSTQSAILEAYLVKKNLTVIPERVQYILGILVDVPSKEFTEELDEELSEQYSELVAGLSNTSVILLNENEGLFQAFSNGAGKPIYKR
jgi:Zn-dependent protease with chaperone function